MQLVLSNYFWLCSLILKAVCDLEGNFFSQAIVELFGTTTAVYIPGVMTLSKQVKTNQIKQKTKQYHLETIIIQELFK